MAELSIRDFTARAGLLWPPRARDLDRILAACGRAGPRSRVAVEQAPRGRLLDHGAGSALLAHLLAPHADVVAYDPGEAPHLGRFHPVTREPPRGPFDLVVSSWMEAGHDLRADVASFGARVLSVHDAEGGCGVKGDLDYASFGLVEAARWTGASFEDVEEALRARGRGLRARARNDFVLWTRPEERDAARASVSDAPRIVARLPWEAEMDALGLA